VGGPPGERSSREWTTCSNLGQPGIPAIVNYLMTLPWLATSANPSNCQTSRYYMIDKRR
jgi:hypothetical protein